MNILNLQNNKKLILYVMKWYVHQTSRFNQKNHKRNNFIWTWVLTQLIYRIQATNVIYFDHDELRTLVYGFMAFDNHVKFYRNRWLKIQVSKLLLIFTTYYIKTMPAALKHRITSILMNHRPNQRDIEYILNL